MPDTASKMPARPAMKRRDELLALAERCEKASEGNRELDRDIHWIGLMGYTHLHDDHFLDPNSGTSGCYKVGGSPKYSTSLDAAVTLVPEGYPIENLSWWPSVPQGYENERRCRLTLRDSDRRGFGGLNRFKGDAATLSLALCAAALRAAAEMEG